MNENLKDKINFLANCIFKAVLLFFVVWIFLPCEGSAAINVDGRLDEPEWADAQRFTEFVVVDPLSLEKPGLSTETLLLSTPDGLSVGFICEQPSESLIQTITERDAKSFNSDSVSLMIDFNGDGQIAYEFSVSISDSYRDGTITNEKSFNYNWDGEWMHAVNEEQNRWTVEILLPWSIVSMRGSSREKRRIGVCFQRQLQSKDQLYAFPAASTDRHLFVSEFERIEVAKHSSQELEIEPYATALGDLLNDSTTGKAGLDILWKPSQKIHLLATVNPEFGYVESDDLVIDFSAYEVRYTEKRPFFTEDQDVFGGIFGLESMFYTRRIGAASDKDGKLSDIEAALKIVGSTDVVNYGIFAAQEADDAGRSFYAGRILFPADNWSAGGLSTYTERPFLDRTALLNSLDFKLNLSDSFRWEWGLIGSKIKIHNNKSDGFGIFNDFFYTIGDRWFFSSRMQYFDDSLDLNDMGYMLRNGIFVRNINARYNQTNFPEDSRSASVSWQLHISDNINTDGDQFPIVTRLSRNEKMRSGSALNAQISLDTNGWDDRISRGNGNVWLNKRWSGSLSYNTQRRGMWSKSISATLFQEGYEDWAAKITSSVTWYPSEKLNISLSLNPQRSSDWLKWIRGKQIGSFSKDQVTSTIGVNWFPAESHEIRLRTQWYTIKATAEQSYKIGADGRLVADNAPLKDFTANNFALQLRYHYEIAPMSDLYIAYSRGGYDYIEDNDQGIFDLLGDCTNLRDSDQILVKLSYRFKIF
jgi:hypothetical protein